MRLARVVWKSYETGYGEQFVMTIGTTEMPQLFVVGSVTALGLAWRITSLVQVLAQFGWIIFTVPGQRSVCRTANMMTGAIMIVVIMRMLGLSAVSGTGSYELVIQTLQKFSSA